MARAMKATKSGVLTQTQVVASVAETNGLKNKQVKGVTEALFAVACGEIQTCRHVEFEVEEEGRDRTVCFCMTETNGLKNKQVNGVVEALFACGEIIDMTPYVKITFVIIWQHSKNEIIFPIHSSMFT